MSTSEKRAWAEVVIWSLLLAWVLVRFTDGIEILGQSLGPRIVEQGVGGLVAIYVAVGILAAIAHLAVQGYFSSRGEDTEFRDERDRAIETRANQVGYWFGIVALNVIIVHVLATEATANGDGRPGTLLTATGVVFVLLAALIAQEIVRNAALLVLYRRS